MGACLHAEVLRFTCLRGAASAKAGHAGVAISSTNARLLRSASGGLQRTPCNDTSLNVFVLISDPGMRIVNFVVRYSFDIVKYSNLSVAESSFGMNGQNQRGVLTHPLY